MGWGAPAPLRRPFGMRHSAAAAPARRRCRLLEQSTTAGVRPSRTSRAGDLRAGDWDTLPSRERDPAFLGPMLVEEDERGHGSQPALRGEAANRPTSSAYTSLARSSRSSAARYAANALARSSRCASPHHRRPLAPRRILHASPRTGPPAHLQPFHRPRRRGMHGQSDLSSWSKVRKRRPVRVSGESRNRSPNSGSVLASVSHETDDVNPPIARITPPPNLGLPDRSGRATMVRSKSRQ